MEMKLNLNYAVRPTDVHNFPSTLHITDYLIRVSVAYRYKGKKMSREEQRIWAKVHDTILEAVTKNNSTADLTEEQVRFVFESVDLWDDVPTPFTSWYITLVDYLSGVVSTVK